MLWISVQGDGTLRFDGSVETQLFDRRASIELDGEYAVLSGVGNVEAFAVQDGELQAALSETQHAMSFVTVDDLFLTGRGLRPVKWVELP